MKNSVILGHMLRLKNRGDAVDGVALAAARANTGGALDKLYAYISAHSEVGAYTAAWTSLIGALRRGIWASAGLALVCGALAAASAFQQSTGTALGLRQVNVFWLFASLLGVHCITFVAWAVAMLRKDGGGVSLLQLAHRALAFILRKSPNMRMAAQCFAHTYLGQPLGPWLMSVVSHGIWALYLAAGCVAAAVLLSIQSYTFIWETTLLNADVATRLIGWLSSPLGVLGLPTPSAKMVLAAQNTAIQPASGKDAAIWAQFSLAAILVYGVLPRVALCALSYSRFKARKATLDIDITEPFFARLLARIYQPAVSRKVIDMDEQGRPARTNPNMSAADIQMPKMLQGAAIVGWEVDRLPDIVSGGELLGLFDQRDDLLRVLDSKSEALICLVVSALNTPDRGVAQGLSPLKDFSPEKRCAVIADLEKLRARANDDDVTRRIGDWWTLLTRLGFKASAIQIEGGNE